MSEDPPKKTLHHPYDNPEQYKKLSPNTLLAGNVYRRISNLWRKKSGQVSPQEVIDLFNNYKEDPRNRYVLSMGEADRFSIYDVWLKATWEADNWMWGGPGEIPDKDVPEHAQLDQVAALIEEATKMAGDWPKDAEGEK